MIHPVILAGGSGTRLWPVSRKRLPKQFADLTGDTYVVVPFANNQPALLERSVGQGRVITVLTGLDGRWTNWPGDPTFVVFLLQSNAFLWSGAAPPTRRFVDDALVRLLPLDDYTDEAIYLPATGEPPRVPIDLMAERVDPVMNPASSEATGPSLWSPAHFTAPGWAEALPFWAQAWARRSRF